MDWNKGYMDGLTLALLAVDRVHARPEDYEEVKELLKKFIAECEAENEKMIAEMEDKK